MQILIDTAECVVHSPPLYKGWSRELGNTYSCTPHFGEHVRWPNHWSSFTRLQ